MHSFNFRKQYKYYPSTSHTLDEITAVIHKGQKMYANGVLEMLGLKLTWFATKHDNLKVKLGKYRLEASTTTLSSLTE